MSRTWASDSLKGIAEIHEAAIRLDALLMGIVRDGDLILSLPASSTLPESPLNRLHDAVSRAGNLRDHLRALLCQFGQKFNNFQIPEPIVAHDAGHLSRKLGNRVFTTSDTFAYINQLLRLYRTGRGIGAANTIATGEILEYLESVESEKELAAGLKELNEQCGIAITPNEADEETDLFAAVEECERNSDETIDLMRELHADLAELKLRLEITTVLPPASSSTDVV